MSPAPDTLPGTGGSGPRPERCGAFAVGDRVRIRPPHPDQGRSGVLVWLVYVAPAHGGLWDLALDAAPGDRPRCLTLWGSDLETRPPPAAAVALAA